MNLSVSPQFTSAAVKPAKPRPKRRRPSSLSVRLSNKERAILTRKAGNRSLAAYIRHMVLGDAEAPRRKTKAKPALDAVLLGQILGMLGQSEQVSCLFMLLAAAEDERVAMMKADRAALQDACANVREIRVLLLKALGLRGDGP